MKTNLLKNILVLILMLFPFMADAQTYEVCLKNGERVVYDYNNVDSIVFKGKKEVAEPFEITFANVTTSSFDVKVTPQDKNMKYIYFIVKADHIANIDDATIVSTDMNFFKEQADILGMDLTEMVNNFAKVGDYEESALGMYHSTEYTAYAYGIDPETLDCITKVSRASVKTESIPWKYPEFNITVDVNGPDADVHVDANGFEDYYYADVFYGMDKYENDPEGLTEAVTQVWNGTFASMIKWMTPEQIVAELCKKGNMDSHYSMEPSKKYLVAAFAVNNDGVVCSDITTKWFETGELQPSDNQIEMTVSDIQSNQVLLTINTSNNDPYVYGLAADDEIPSDSSDEDIVRYVINNCWPQALNGSCERTEKWLSPDTKYWIYAFGYQANTATTKVFKTSFTTLPSSKSSQKTRLTGGSINDGVKAKQPVNAARWINNADRRYLNIR